MSAFVSAYPKTFSRFLGFNNITFNSTASGEEYAKYENIDIWLASAFDVITTWCNQTIQATTGKVFTIDFSKLLGQGEYYNTIYYFPESREQYYHYNVPVLKVPFAVTAISYMTDRFATSPTVIDSSDYVVVVENGVQRIYFKNYIGNYTGSITANVGWSDTAMPEPIQRVAYEMVSEVYRESTHGGGRFGLTQKGETLQGASSTTVFKDLTPRYEKLLSPYIVPILV